MLLLATDLCQPAPIQIKYLFCAFYFKHVQMLAPFRHTVFCQHEGSLFLLLQCVVTTKRQQCGKKVT